MKSAQLFRKSNQVWHWGMCVLFFLSAPILFDSVNAATPPLINYQAAISNSLGNPLDTTVNVIFSIYDGPSSVTPLWTETHNSLTISEGRLSVLLGTMTPITDQLFSDTGRYIGIKIGGDNEMTPRSRLLSVPYALRLETIDGASGGDVSGALRISPDPAKIEGDALIIANTNGTTILSVKVTSDGSAVVSLFDPVDSKDGSRLVPVEQVQITMDGIIILDSTGLDTTLVLNSLGNITGTGQITMGQGSSDALGTTILGNYNTANGDTATISGGTTNSISGSYSTIGGGQSNSANAGGLWATIGGGKFNSTNGNYTTIGGGYANLATASSSTVGGGSQNNATGVVSTIGGGSTNRASGYASAVGGGVWDSAMGVHSGVFSGNSNLAGDASIDTGAFVGGGNLNLAAEPYSTVAGGRFNWASDNYSFVGGGEFNRALGLWATIAGGSFNQANFPHSTVGGGFLNVSNADYATIAGGRLDSASYYATVGGGDGNVASGSVSTIAGGSGNRANGPSTTIGGGQGNSASGTWATVGGGNQDTAAGNGSTVPGGYQNNAAGDYSFAAGRRARAMHTGSFVWADASDTVFESSAANQFNVRASGGVRIYTNDTLASGVTMGAGASSWTSVSDISVKKDFRSIDSDELLERLSEIPISRWKYIAEVSQADHIGPMSQDFYSAFGLGDDDKRISTIDADGVALAAIQALYKENLELKKRLDELETLIKQK